MSPGLARPCRILSTKPPRARNDFARKLDSVGHQAAGTRANSTIVEHRPAAAFFADEVGKLRSGGLRTPGASPEHDPAARLRLGVTAAEAVVELRQVPRTCPEPERWASPSDLAAATVRPLKLWGVEHRIAEDGDARIGPDDRLLRNCSRLALSSGRSRDTPGDVAARPREARTRIPSPTGSPPDQRHDDGNAAGRALGSRRRASAPSRDEERPG